MCIFANYLRWLPEDDTMFSERTASTFGNVVYRRSGAPTPGRFCYCLLEAFFCLHSICLIF